MKLTAIGNCAVTRVLVIIALGLVFVVASGGARAATTEREGIADLLTVMCLPGVYTLRPAAVQQLHGPIQCKVLAHVRVHQTSLMRAAMWRITPDYQPRDRV